MSLVTAIPARSRGAGRGCVEMGSRTRPQKSKNEKYIGCSWMVGGGPPELNRAYVIAADPLGRFASACLRLRLARRQSCKRRLAPLRGAFGPNGYGLSFDPNGSDLIPFKIQTAPGLGLAQTAPHPRMLVLSEMALICLRLGPHGVGNLGF